MKDLEKKLLQLLPRHYELITEKQNAIENAKETRDLIVDLMTLLKTNRIEGEDYTGILMQRPGGIDTKKLREKYPEVYKDCIRETPTQALTVKMNRPHTTKKPA